MNDVFHLQVGKPAQISNLAPNAVIAGYMGYFEQAGIAAKLTYWTDPEDADPNARCSRMWVLRCDGMTDDEIEALKEPSKKKMQMRFHFDPNAWNETFPPNQRIRPPANGRPKPSQKGWERMAINESRMFRIGTRDLRVLITVAICKRGLSHTFRCERVPYLEDKGKRNP